MVIRLLIPIVGQVDIYPKIEDKHFLTTDPSGEFFQIDYFQLFQFLFRNRFVNFEHVDGLDFAPDQRIIDTIIADSKQQSASEIIIGPIDSYPTFAVLLTYKRSDIQDFSNPTGKFSKHIIDCSQEFICIAKDVVGIVLNDHLEISFPFSLLRLKQFKRYL